MRDIKELYQILWDNLEDLDIVIGICCEISTLYYLGLLSFSEKERLLINFKSNKPSKEIHSEFYNNSAYNKDSVIGAFWWEITDMKKSSDQRKLFIQKLIQITN